MKKLTVWMVAMLATFALVACGGAKTVDTAKLAQDLLALSYEEELVKLADEEVEYYVELVDGATCEMYMSSGSTAEEIIIVTCKDSNAAVTMKENVEAFLADQASSFEAYIPEETKRIESATVVQNGNYVVVCVCADAAAAQDIINKAFQ